jgi:hypothetical protein
VGGVAAYAQHNTTLAQILAAPAKTVVAAVGHPFMQQAAQNRPVVKLYLTGSVARDGQKIQLANAGQVRPGEIVSFTLDSVNEGSAVAREYRAIGQIPQGSIFVVDSAMAESGTRITYSINDGQEFSPTPMIDERQPDGSTKKVAAPVSMYTQVRFEWADPLAPGGKLMTSYQVRVK